MAAWLGWERGREEEREKNGVDRVEAGVGEGKEVEGAKEGEREMLRQQHKREDSGYG